MSTNSFETFNSSPTPFDTPFPGATEVAASEPTNPFAEKEEVIIMNNINPFADSEVVVSSTEDNDTEDSDTDEDTMPIEKKKRGRRKVETVDGEPVEKKEMAPRLTADQKSFVINNYASMGSEKVALELGVNINQVRTTISQFRKLSNKLLQDPKTSEEEKERLEKFIDIYLPKRVAGEPTSKEKKTRKASNLTIIENLISNMMA